MDQPFITAGLLAAGFVGCLVSVGTSALWPLIPAVVCAVAGSVLLGFAGIAKPLLVERLLAELEVAPEGVTAEVRWAHGRLAMVATSLTAHGPHRVTADPGTLPFRPGHAVAVVEVGALRDGDPRAIGDLVSVLGTDGRVRAVEAKPAAARLAEALSEAGLVVDQRRTWLTWPPSVVVEAALQAHHQ